MATGRVLQFDDTRGFGFIAADDGGEDVFLHASVFDGESVQLTPGTRVEFEVMAGDRGRKAYAAHVLRDSIAAVEHHTPEPVAKPETAPGSVDEVLCDVLSPSEFTHEVTELLFVAAPDLTGRQILQLRRGLLELAQKRGWVDT